MIGGNYTETTRDSWTTVPGRSEELERDENGNITKITYYEGDSVVFAQYFTLNDSGQITKIECQDS